MLRIKSITGNERGVALMMVLLIATITLTVTTAMLYMLTQSTRYSGSQKRYASAMEAAVASYAVSSAYITKGAQFMEDYNLKLGFQNYNIPCVSDKLDVLTTEWDSACSRTLLMDVGDLASSLVGDPSTYDVSFELGDYKIFSKIVYTIPGNTARAASGDVVSISGKGLTSGRFQNTCVIHCDGGTNGGGTAGAFGGQAIPSTYIVEVDARSKLNPQESAKISILFQY